MGVRKRRSEKVGWEGIEESIGKSIVAQSVRGENLSVKQRAVAIK
jgi:hypothetical protein